MACQQLLEFLTNKEHGRVSKWGRGTLGSFLFGRDVHPPSVEMGGGGGAREQTRRTKIIIEGDIEWGAMEQLEAARS